MFNGNSQSASNGKRSLLSQTNGHHSHYSNGASSSKNGYSSFAQFKKPKPNGYSNGYHPQNGRDYR
jgi:hypothetical protein